MIVGFRDKGWFDFNTDRALWTQLTRAYGEEFSWHADWIPLPNSPIVVFDEDASLEITDFVHPPNATYVFGRSCQARIHDNIFHDYAVRIDTPHRIPLFGFEAAAIALHDRAVKWQLTSEQT